ncbi:MAG: hypothetical protein MJE77_45465 [Proteobacteria bacterium]|nr:hypothetical protein [Pseudomonadota bacterium]
MAARRTKKTVIGTAIAYCALILLACGLAGAAAPKSGEHSDPNPDHFNWTELDYKDKDIHGGTLDPGEQEMSPPVLLLFMNFAVVLFIVGWRLAPPVKEYARKRHTSIKEALEEAARLRDEAQTKLDEYTEQVARAEAEVDKLIEDIRASAEAEKKRIVADAEAQAEAMKREAETRIAAELSRARLEIEREVVAKAVAAAEKLIRENATAGDQTQLVDVFISDMQKQAVATREQEGA